MKRAKSWKEVRKSIVGDNRKREFSIQLEQAKIDLAQVIYDHREQLGLTQNQLADKMGCKQQYIAKVESGEANMTFETLIRFMTMFNIVLKVEHAKKRRANKIIQFISEATV